MVFERMRKIVLLLMMTIAMLLSVQASAKDVVLVLDPGHGGTESGAAREGYREEVINQKISNYLKTELEKYAGIKVYLTRSGVNQPAMNREERVNIAKALHADALISIHINATGYYTQTMYSGACALVPSLAYSCTAANEARRLGRSILAGLSAKAGTVNGGLQNDDELGIILFALKKNYTLKEAKALGMARAVLNTQIPSMIIEHCFIDHPGDRTKFLSSNTKIKKLALGDAEGIAKFFGLKKKNSGSIVEKPKPTGLVYEQAEGVWYLYDDFGNPMEGLVKYNKKFYYCEDHGLCRTGWVWVGNRHYYFDEHTAQGLSGIYQIGKYQYYFKLGYSRSKWVTVNGKRYFGSRKDGHLMTKYWLSWNGYWYYLNANGNPWTSCKKKIDGVSYRFDAEGHCINKT